MAYVVENIPPPYNEEEENGLDDNNIINNTDNNDKTWKFSSSNVYTNIDPYNSKTLTILLTMTGVKYQHMMEKNDGKWIKTSCCYNAWCYFWDIPHLLLSLQGFILYFSGLCDLLYFLFAAFIPCSVVMIRHRYKKWHESGIAKDSMQQPSMHIPLSKKEIDKYDGMCVTTCVMNPMIMTWFWAAFTLWIPLLWIESASAKALPFYLKIIAQVVEISAWLSGGFAFFSFYNTSTVVILAYLSKYQKLVEKTTELLNRFDNVHMNNKGNNNNNRSNNHQQVTLSSTNEQHRKNKEIEVMQFVKECLPHHMEMCRSMHKYSSSTSVSHLLSTAGVMWLISMCYINAFILTSRNENAWWYVRPW